MSRLTGSGLSVAYVALGLICVGGGTAAALSLAAHTQPAAEFAAFATWLTLANLAGLAFIVVEMYLPRLLLTASAQGEDERPVLVAFTRGVLVAVALLSAGLILASPWIVPNILDGKRGLFVLVLVYMAALSLQTIQRGVAVGRGRFKVFSVQLGFDGLTRLIGAAGLAVTHLGSAEAFAAVMCAGALVGILAGTGADRHWTAMFGPRAAVAIAPVVLLGVSSLGPLIVNNAGVPWLASLDGPSSTTIGAVAGALFLSRVPTLLVGAAYGPLLAPLAAAVDGGDGARFRRLHAQALAGAMLLAATFAVGFALAGPLLLRVYLGPGFALGQAQLAAMAGGSGLMFVCVVEQAAVVALAAWRWIAYGWAVGIAAFVGLLATSLPPVDALAAAVLLAPLAAALVMTLGRARSQTRLLDLMRR